MPYLDTQLKMEETYPTYFLIPKFGWHDDCEMFSIGGYLEIIFPREGYFSCLQKRQFLSIFTHIL